MLMPYILPFAKFYYLCLSLAISVMDVWSFITHVSASVKCTAGLGDN